MMTVYIMMMVFISMCQYVLIYVCNVCRDTVRDVVRLLLALNARSHAVSLARQTNVSLAD